MAESRCPVPLPDGLCGVNAHFPGGQQATASLGNDRQYVLMTAAHNEERLIPQTISSVIAQTVQPLKWVIASDNSTDGTDDIVRHYASKHPFIELLRVTRIPGRHFGAKVMALQRASKILGDLPFDFI